MTDSTDDPLQAPDSDSSITVSHQPHRDAAGTRLFLISPEVPAYAMYDLAQFVKRIRFDQCLELTDSWRSRTERNDQAYRMLAGLNAIAVALANMGYAPR